MQNSTTVPDSPTLSDSSKKKSNSKRAKASVACHECRKRKVKCEGVQPCGRCRKSNFRCIFPQQQSSKRGPPKQYIEILEARLQLMEKALRTIGGPASEILDDALSLDHHALQDKNGIHEDDTTIQQPNEFHPTPNSIQQQLPDQYSMNEIGQPYYTHDIYHHQIHSSYHSTPPPPQQQQRHMDLRRQPSDLSLSNNNNSGIKSEPTTPVPSSHCLANIDSSLIDKYFEHVHPYTPMIDMPAFTQQLMNPNNPPPMLLLYAMCAVAARWSSSYATHSNEPAGFSYYQRAFVLIDETGVTPRVSTIQALVLLTKYQEHYKRAGYFYRPGYYLALAVDMCYSLKLPTLVSAGGGPGGPGDTLDNETKKRTFWMTFLYDLWTSIEEGRETRFNNSQCSTDYPLSSGDSNGLGSEDLVTRHNVVIRLGRILSDIYGFSRRLASRQQIQGSVRTTSQQMEEEGRLVVIQTTLDTYLREISVIPRFDYAPSTTIDNGKYPADTTNTAVPEVFVGFLHMMYHYSIILLHRHHVLYPITKQQNDANTHPYPHQQLCATSASIINSIANSLLESNSMDAFHYPTRGVQFTILCVTMAIAVHKFEMETAQDEQRKSSANTLYWQALSIVNKLSTETSAVELRYLARDAELAEMCGKLAVDNNNNNSTNSMQQPLSPDGSSSFTTTNNDGSSTSSSSPVLSSSVVSTSTGSVTDMMNRPTKMTKPPRRGTVSGSHLKRFPSQIFTPDCRYENNATTTTTITASTMPSTASSPSAYIHLPSSGQPSPTSVSSCSQPQPHSPHGSVTSSSSSTISPAALFNSSASITDPARLASMMQFGNIPLTPYNHHQQPIQLPMQIQQQQQQQQQQQPQRRMPRPLHHHYSHSQEDLRSLNHRHMNKTGYARAASPGTPSESRLKKHRSMKFLPMHSQQLQHTVQQYPPPSSLHVNSQQQRVQQQQQSQPYQRQQQYHHHHHHHHQIKQPVQPSYDQQQQQQQQQANYHPTPPPQAQQHVHVQQQHQRNEPHHYNQNYAPPHQSMMPTTTSMPPPPPHQMNFSGMVTTPLHRRHTISFTGMDTTGFMSPLAMDYSSSASMMQIDATTDLHQQQQQYPMHQDMTMTSSPSLSSNSQPMTNAFTPMIEDDSQMMMMTTSTDVTNTMHHLLGDSMAAWGNGSLDMDRKTEAHVLQ